MKAVYLKNFRNGFATNSSSTHSIIYRNKGEMFEDLNVFELDYYDRFDETIAASREAKIKYIAANIMYNSKLLECMCALYPEMKKYLPKIKKKIKKHERYKKGEIKYKDLIKSDFGMYCRGNISFEFSDFFEASIDYLKYIIDNDDIIIIGGSDEMDFVYDHKKNHETLPLGEDISYSKKGRGVFKNGNYWVAYDYFGKRLRYKTEKGDCIPSYPELIDLKITNKCEHGCNFCYMSSNVAGKHADISFLKRVINELSSSDYDYYRKKIEFSIGGGNILLYPHLEELFKHLKKKNHIINTTINVKDCEKILNDEKISELFKEYVSGIGVSISSKEDIKYLYYLREWYNNCGYKDIVIHLIPELLGVEKTRELIEECKKISIYNYLFLGYKTNGRGINHKVHKFNDNELKELFNELYSASIDTTFANNYKEWLDNNFETEFTVTFNEGEYSMYIDGVEEKAYKSSYQLDKPYNLYRGEWEEKDKIWFGVNDAFKNIRKDNGFLNYKE